MRAGRLRHLVTVQALTDGVDARGGLTESWATHATRWARIVPLGGREAEVSSRATAQGTHRFEMRALTTATPKMRVSWNSRVFDIDAVLHLEERGRETHLITTERV